MTNPVWHAGPEPDMNEWQPIETAPLEPFDADRWYMPGPEILVWCHIGVTLARYGYTKQGKGRWRDLRGEVHPTHWMPLPEPPKDAP